MTLYSLLKFLHVVSAVIFVGGVLARQSVRGYAKKPGIFPASPR